MCSERKPKIFIFNRGCHERRSKTQFLIPRGWVLCFYGKDFSPTFWVGSKNMNWKNRIAKEWLWLLCAVGGAIALWSILSFTLRGPDWVGRYWQFLVGQNDGSKGTHLTRIITIVPMIAIYVIRFNWNVRQKYESYGKLRFLTSRVLKTFYEN